MAEDKFQGLFGERAGATHFPGTRCADVTFDDAEDTSFVCRYFTCSDSGTLKVTTYDGQEISIQVFAGVNPHRIRRFWDTGSDAITVQIWD